jgi:hypothetical protein
MKDILKYIDKSFYYYKGKDLFWFRIFGRGLSLCKDWALDYNNLREDKNGYRINKTKPKKMKNEFIPYEEAQIACLKMLIDSVIKQKEQ